MAKKNKMKVWHLLSIYSFIISQQFLFFCYKEPISKFVDEYIPKWVFYLFFAGLILFYIGFFVLYFIDRVRYNFGLMKNEVRIDTISASNIDTKSISFLIALSLFIVIMIDCVTNGFQFYYWYVFPFICFCLFFGILDIPSGSVKVKKNEKIIFGGLLRFQISEVDKVEIKKDQIFITNCNDEEYNYEGLRINEEMAEKIKLLIQSNQITMITINIDLA